MNTIEINLIPLKTRQQRWGRPLAIVGTVLFVVILAGLSYLYINDLNQRNKAMAMLNETQAALQKLDTEDQTHATERLQLQSKVKQLQKGATQTEDLLTTLTGLLPAGGSLTNFDYQGHVVTVTGQFKTLDDVAGFQHALQTSSLVTSASLGKLGAASANAFSADFTIQLNPAADQTLGGSK